MEFDSHYETRNLIGIKMKIGFERRRWGTSLFTLFIFCLAVVVTQNCSPMQLARDSFSEVNSLSEVGSDFTFSPVSGANPASEPDFVVFPNENLAFILGPQVKINSKSVTVPRYDRIALDAGLNRASDFPYDFIKCPSLSNPTCPDQKPDEMVYQYYYDLALVFYQLYYRTNNPAFLTAARGVADSIWSGPVNKNGAGDSAGVSPRESTLGGLIVRAQDGRPEIWPGILRFLDEHYEIWVGPRLNYESLYYGAREIAYVLLYATWVAKTHPDVAIREKWQGKVKDALEKYVLRVQRKDGAWIWNDPYDPWGEGGFINISQPFHVGLLLEALIAYHRLTGDYNTGLAIVKACEYLWNKAYRAKIPITDQSGKFWRSFLYFSEGGTKLKPDSFNLTSDPGGPAGDDPNLSVNGARQATGLIVHAFGYAYFLTNNPKYLVQGDDMFDAVYSKSDGYEGLHYLAAYKPSLDQRSFNQSYRSSGKYLAWRKRLDIFPRK